ncbi:MAG: hypothetical protein NWF00_02240 [Candidatus Bathyarchaeota archaeon]|nr:hypothetical protein [Candidatus Bathyarchaeota archaeon]
MVGGTNSFAAGIHDAWLIKTDSSGIVLWNCTYGGIGEDGASALVQTADGGYACAGSTNSYGNGNFDFWLVKTDGDGNALWNQTFGGAGARPCLLLS